MRRSFVASALFSLVLASACGEIQSGVDAPPGAIDSATVDGASDDAPTVIDAPTIDAPIDAAPVKRVFISSATFFPDFGGPTQADTACQNMANAAGLPGIFRAWMSTPSNSVAGRFTQSTLPYVMVDGTVIANNWADLTDGTVAHGIDRTEAGNVLPNTGIAMCHGTPTCFQTFTGTNANGTAFTGDDQCLDWTTRVFQPPSGGLNTFSGGDSSMAGSEWTLRASGFRCDYQARIYCVQQ